jgi:acetyltransferase
VDTISQLFDCAEALGKMERPPGPNLAIITNAGGPGVMAVDAFSKWNLEPAALSDATLNKLNQFLSPMWSHANPVDLLGDAPPEHYSQAVQVLLAAPEFQGLVVIFAPQAVTDPAEVAQTLASEVKSRAKPLIAVWMGGEQVAAGRSILNQAGIPTFSAPEEAVDTFMEMYTYSRNLELLQETPPRLPADLKVKDKQARTFIDESFKRGARILNEIESKAILSAYGIPVNYTVAASTAAAAAKSAAAMGFPVVLKINSPDISHKSEVDGVRVHLHSEADVLAAFGEITGKAKAALPEARIFGVTVQTQVKGDLELILGSKRDPDFGPIILFGLGGVLTEAFRDTAVDLPPLNLLLARRLMERTQVYRLLKGFRTLPPADLTRVEEILVRLSQLVTDFPEIVELDINPLLITTGQPVAVDARIIIEPSSLPAPRHLIISPYPNQYESDWLLEDGTPVLLRPMRPEDEALVADFLKDCSDETLYFRYFQLIKHWTHQMLIRFTQNDYDREMGLTAFGQPPGPEVMMGVVRLVMAPDRDTAEFAVIVADPWQGKGLGQKLIERGLEIARENGVRLLWGEVLAENQPMLELVRKLGFTVKLDVEGGIRRVEMLLSGGDS